MLRIPDQARNRIRDEMTRQKMSQRDMAGLLEWSQSRVAKILTGRVELSVGDLEAMCFALGISVIEAIRDQGLEFCAEMTPSEVRLLERVRQLQPKQLDALMTVLDIRGKTRPQERRAAAQNRKLS